MPKATLTPHSAVREVSLQEAKDHLDDLVAEVERDGSEVVLRQEGKAVARLVPSALRPEEARDRFFSGAEDLRRAFSDVPSAELNARIDRAVADVRGKRPVGGRPARRNP